ncbi:hypothetical protein BC830DRAFT_1072817 [Chytriomyces sp. MP71]|nr:hypothetical protein BC830DRAFT_1072817 [Chytriomyces sp. MP71]
MPAFKNIAILGGTATIGQQLIKDLLANKDEFASVVLLTRDPESTKAKELSALGAIPRRLPSELSAPSSRPHLVEALKGIDVVVSMVGAAGIPEQEALIYASIEAGVTRFIPSEYGINGDLHAPSVGFIGEKVPIRALLRSPEVSVKLEHTIVLNGYFVDGFFSAFYGWDFDKAPTAVGARVAGAGDVPISLTKQTDVAHYLAEILRAEPAVTRNKVVQVEGDRITWNQAVLLVKELLPGATMTVNSTTAEELEKQVVAAKGYDFVRLSLYLAIVRGQALLSHNHNKLFPAVKPVTARAYLQTLFNF